MPGRRGIWARIASDGSTARMLRPKQSLKGGGERAGARADVRHGHPGHRVEVTSYRVTPVPEPVSRDLADRLERRRGQFVVADPGHVVPPSYCPRFAMGTGKRSWSLPCPGRRCPARRLVRYARMVG